MVKHSFRKYLTYFSLICFISGLRSVAGPFFGALLFCLMLLLNTNPSQVLSARSLSWLPQLCQLAFNLQPATFVACSTGHCPVPLKHFCIHKQRKKRDAQFQESNLKWRHNIVDSSDLNIYLSKKKKHTLVPAVLEQPKSSQIWCRCPTSNLICMIWSYWRSQPVRSCVWSTAAGWGRRGCGSGPPRGTDASGRRSASLKPFRSTWNKSGKSRWKGAAANRSAVPSPRNSPSV